MCWKSYYNKYSTMDTYVPASYICYINGCTHVVFCLDLTRPRTRSWTSSRYRGGDVFVPGRRSHSETCVAEPTNAMSHASLQGRTVRCFFVCVLSFWRHWTHKPDQTVKLFPCPCCSKTFGRKDNVMRHCKIIHKVAASVEVKVVDNKNFVCPGEIHPYRLNMRTLLQEKRKRTETLAASLVTERADCRDEVVTFKEDGTTTTKKFKHQ